MSFKFKQFEIQQDKSAMKVGTDGVILGAWVNAINPSRILDVGSGTGLISLMMAQKYSNAQVYAVEIEKEAFLQSIENISKSLWQDRIYVYNDDFLEFSKKTEFKFDIIVSNPPFFENHLHSSDEKKQLARHNDTLPFDQFVESVANLLKKNGSFFVILPFVNHEYFVHLCEQRQLFCNKKTSLKHTPNSSIKRILMKFSFEPSFVQQDVISIKVNNLFSEEYKKLTKDFYLFF
ncbi:MAG: methyltransferase [Bacteroidales bacterium]|nr:methyltransferase [Bacteroidales bacterium]